MNTDIIQPTVIYKRDGSLAMIRFILLEEDGKAIIKKLISRHGITVEEGVDVIKH